MTGTNMTQKDYEKLQGAARDTAMTDAEAIILVNQEFGFEAS